MEGADGGACAVNCGHLRRRLAVADASTSFKMPNRMTASNPLAVDKICTFSDFDMLRLTMFYGTSCDRSTTTCLRSTKSAPALLAPEGFKPF